jgi:hypothetical protein
MTTTTVGSPDAFLLSVETKSKPMGRLLASAVKAHQQQVAGKVTPLASQLRH